MPLTIYSCYSRDVDPKIRPESGIDRTVRLPANDVLYDEIKHLLICPVGRPSRKQVSLVLGFLEKGTNRASSSMIGGWEESAPVLRTLPLCAFE